MKIAYIRVSSKDQNEGRQVEKMLSLNIEERFIFIDKASGKNFDRPRYKAMKEVLRDGDILYIDSLDRLGRDYDGIIREWEHITRELKADIVALDMEGLFDSRKFREMGDIGKLMEDQFLALLSYVAEQERKKIKQRQKEGIALCLKEGRSYGRPRIQTPDNFPKEYKDWHSGQITAAEAMRRTGLKPNTFYRLVAKQQEQAK
jgi:DNA invertase Pin-like site-specific DNA recombinase